MSSARIRIYCDESGFTGNRMLDPAQPHLVTGSLALSPERADQLVRDARARFNLKAHELKGARLLGRPRGRQAAAWLIDEIGDSALVHFSDKAWALACRTYDALFEPVLPDDLPLYALGFHKFVGAAVWKAKLEGDRAAEAWISGLEAVARRRGREPFARMLDRVAPACSDRTDMDAIVRFCRAFETRIDFEVAGSVGELPADSPSRWPIDLSVTSLFALLAAWSERVNGPLDVVCDDSKPIVACRDLFDAQVGRVAVPTIQIGEQVFPGGLKLHKRIEFCASNAEPGLQLADVVAASFAERLNAMNTDPEAKRWLAVRLGCLAERSLIPEPELADGSTRRSRQCRAALGTLAAAAEAGEDPAECVKYALSHARVVT